MKLSEIKSVLDGQLTLTDLLNRNKTDIENYKRLIKKQGASISISIRDDIDKLLFTSAHLKLILEAYLNSELDEFQLHYLIDAITLSENVSFANVYIRDLIDNFIDPDIHRNTTTRKAIEVLDQL